MSVPSVATVAASGNEVEKTDEVECACVRIYVWYA